MIAALLVCAAALVALWWVATPLRRPAPADPGAPDRFLPEAERRKRAALEALVELDEERDAGKLSEQDHAALAERYEREAVAALRELDEITAGDDRLEAEIAAVRERLRCPTCGAVRPPGSPCERCGS